ncbi:uncharacterized protein LOC113756465 [Coffea eugenioides]|uniref:uncharacterized protein LOC113756465 n=1 Tax=Coffea eugenioides TaxID=49369 RepID=UPI000F604ADA|nr:uncharacterized protein LOC113756465 [Coffea eugenioides]
MYLMQLLRARSELSSNGLSELKGSGASTQASSSSSSSSESEYIPSPAHSPVRAMAQPEQPVQPVAGTAAQAVPLEAAPLRAKAGPARKSGYRLQRSRYHPSHLETGGCGRTGTGGEGWKAQFFNVKNIGFPPPTWREETQVSDPLPSPLPEAELDRLLSSDLRLSVKEFNNAQLWAAGLIRANVSTSAPDTRPLTLDDLATLKRFSQLLKLGGAGSSSAPTSAPSAVPASSVPPPPPPVPTQQALAQSSPAEEHGKKKRKKSTAKRARTEVTSSPAQAEESAPTPHQFGHYGVNSAE